MNNLTTPTPFSFLAIKPKLIQRSTPNCCGSAWCYDSFHLGGNNYYLYTCQRGEKLIKKGTQSKEVLNWGGWDE